MPTESIGIKKDFSSINFLAMADFDTSHVKNIVLLGHAGSGKTTLAECMLFEAGIISRRGSIAERNTTGDYHELEQDRGNSIFSKLLHTKWRGYKINIQDTPGYDDFVGEVISALRVADTGVMLLNAAMGVEVGTDIIWEYTEKFKTPMIFAVNELDEDEMKEGMKKAMINHDLFPLFCLSAIRNMGSGRLMGFIDNVCPSANEMPPQKTRKGDELPCEASGPACIFIYKTVNESHVGELSFFKVYSGTIRSGMELENESTGVTEKINQLFMVEGNKRASTNELVAGDIGATLKVKNTHVNNPLHARRKHYDLNPIEFPQPNVTVAIEPTKKGEEEKLSVAMHQLREEDPTLIVEV